LVLRVEDFLEMSVDDFLGWAAFYKIEADEHNKLMQKTRSR
jgi:hypothetical protein